MAVVLLSSPPTLQSTVRSLLRMVACRPVGRHLNGHPRVSLVSNGRKSRPPVVALGNRAMGEHIRDLIPYEFGGTVDFVLAPRGSGAAWNSADWLGNQHIEPEKPEFETGHRPA